MLQNFIICCNSVVPSAIYLIVGILLKMCRVITDAEVKRFTHIIFVTLYPFMMFDNLYGKAISDNLDALLIIYCVGFTLFQIIASWVTVCRIEPDNYDRGPMIQAAFRSNIVLMGLPVGINLFGKGNVTAVAIVILFVVPIYNTVSVIVLEHFRGGKADILQTVKRVLKNPIIVGAIVAGVFMILHITLPASVYSAVQALSDATAPLALILLGAALDLSGFSSDRGKIAFCVIGKLLVFPAIGIAGAVLLGIRDVGLIAFVLMVATPTALASYAMASAMGGNGKLAGEAVVISTIAACFTMPIWLFILKTLGYF